MPFLVHYFVMMVCIFRPKLGEKYEYMVLVRYKYHESMKLHLHEGLDVSWVFTTMVLMLWFSIKHGTGRATPRWIA